MGLKLNVGGTEANITSEFRISQLSVWFDMAQSYQAFDNNRREQDGIAPQTLH